MSAKKAAEALGAELAAEAAAEAAEEAMTAEKVRVKEELLELSQLSQSDHF